jgi:pyruvate carboxylase
VDIFRVFDSLNYVDNLKFGIDSVGGGGGALARHGGPFA